MERFASNELSKRVDEVLYYVWDPIGVKDEPYARAEYRSYVENVLGLLENNQSAHEIAEYLNRIEADSMELTPNKNQAIRAAHVLLQHKKAIDEGHA